MRSEKPFLDSELTLAGLAERLAVPPRQLSQAINGGLGRNFLDFVNGFRVEEAKHYLEDPQEKRSILDIALLAGFNSKSAFYTAFKRQTGQTPSAYRQSRLGQTAAGALPQRH